jgi:hypothetical protein
VDDLWLVRRVASQIVFLRGSFSPAFIAEQMELAREVGDRFSTEAWQDIGEVVAEILRTDPTTQKHENMC